MTTRELLPPTVGTWDVTTFRFLAGEATAGQGPVYTLPDGWMPLSMAEQGEWVIVLLYRQTA